MLTVTQIAKAYNISRTTILYYERAGLLYLTVAPTMAIVGMAKKSKLGWRALSLTDRLVCLFRR